MSHIRKLRRRLRRRLRQPPGQRLSLQQAPHLALGARGEMLAAGFLRAEGYRLVATNFSAPIGRTEGGRMLQGEIDIIAYDETCDPPVLAFIEVKTRSGSEVASPLSAVDRRKQRRIIRTARLYRRLLRIADEPYRYDVVGIVYAKGAGPQIELRRGYFSERRHRHPYGDGSSLRLI